MKFAFTLVLGTVLTLALTSAHATVITSSLPNSGSISVDTAQVDVDSFGTADLTGTGIPGGVALSFSSLPYSNDPHGGIPGIYRYHPESSLPSDLWLSIDVPLTFEGDASRSGFELNIKGISRGWMDATGAWNNEYVHRLTLVATDSLGQELSIIDQPGRFAILGLDEDGLTPFTASALIPSGFDLASLKVKLSVDLIYLPVGLDGTAPAGTIHYTVGISEIQSLSIHAVPEPTTWSLMALGLGGIFLASRTKRRRH